MSEDSPRSPSRYLVEWYQQALSAALLEETERQLGRSAAEVSREGAAVSLLLTLFMPDDEVAFCLFAAASPASVEQACRRGASVRTHQPGHHRTGRQRARPLAHRQPRSPPTGRGQRR